MASNETLLDAEGKIQLIVDTIKRSGLSWFIETGSASGHTAAGVYRGSGGHLARIITVELDEHNYRSCVRKFLKTPKILPVHGDSAVILNEICRFVPGPAVWWLDAHYNEGHQRGPVDCPVMAELYEIITRHPQGQWILIDDARLFGTEPGYPTIQAVTDEIAHHSGDSYVVTVEDDVIRAVPR